jgi:succinyl-diaminopimelate desuccinylase
MAMVFAKTKEAWVGKLKLGLVCDEEGMMIGIKHYIKQGHADEVTACLVPEPEENNLCISMKGAIRAIVRVHGKMAHGAMPLTGINPNTRLARIILAFEEFETAEKKRCGKDPFIGLPSVTFTVVQSPPPGSPAQLNVMPSEAVGYVDIRTTLAQDHDQVRAALRGILSDLGAKDPDFKADIEYIEDRPVVGIPKDSPIAAISAQAYRDITGKEPVWNGVPGATDGTFLSAWKKIPCLVNGPGPRHIPHQKDEYVEVEELFESAKIYALAAGRFLAEGIAG